MRKIKEILRLKYEAKLTERQIARGACCSRWAVRSCVRQAEATGVSWPLPQGLDEEALEALLYSPRPSTARFPLPDFDAIRDSLSTHKGMTRLLAWEEYRRAQPSGMQYSAFCDRFRAWLKTQDLALRLAHEPGSALYVDYAGETAYITDRETGAKRVVKIFVAVLGYSNLIYAEATAGETTADWISAQVRALEYCGGVPGKIVPDNPKALVTRTSRYEPDLNPSYQDFAVHYSVAIVPARVREPRDKAKVETGVQIAERFILAPLRNQTFFSPAEFNAAIRVRVDALNDKPFQKLPGSRRSRFEEAERAALRPLPARPYAFAVWKKTKVHLDYHVEVERHYYSVPHAHAGKTVDIRLAERTIEVFLRGKVVAAHVRSRVAGEATTTAAHRPERHQGMIDLSHEKLLSRAEKIGPATAEMVGAQLHQRNHPDQVLRISLGILRLANDYTPEALETASIRALEVNVFSYRALQGFLRAPRPETPAPPPRIEHENIRGAQYFEVLPC
jgi:transposase